MRPLLRQRDIFLTVTGGWAAIGLALFATEAVLAGAGAAWPRLTDAASWWAVTLLGIGLTDLLPLRNARRYDIILIHVLAGTGAALLRAAAVHHLNTSLFPGWLTADEGGGAWPLFEATYATTLLVYLAVVAAAHGILFALENRAAELEAARARALAVEAELQALKMEIQPHFLFNTLNAVSALMHRDVSAANEMLVLLADMLEASIETVREQEVELAAELETLRIYVRIQRIRMGDRLDVAWDIDPETLRARVPPLILQPLVENAIVHGIGERAGGGRVEIAAHRNGRWLDLLVRDDGAALPPAVPGFGLGVANTRARLRQLHGDDQRFTIADAPGGGTIAYVCIPFTSAGPGKPPRPAP